VRRGVIEWGRGGLGLWLSGEKIEALAGGVYLCKGKNDAGHGGGDGTQHRLGWAGVKIGF